MQTAFERRGETIVRRFAGASEVEREPIVIGSQIELAHDRCRPVFDPSRVGRAVLAAGDYGRRNMRYAPRRGAFQSFFITPASGRLRAGLRVFA